MTDFLYGLLCGSATIICLSARFLYEDVRRKYVCIAASVLFLISTAASFFPPDLSHPNAMLFNFCAILALARVLYFLQAHYLLLYICFLWLCTHTFGFLIATDYVLVNLSVYNDLVLTLEIMFVILLLALSDAGMAGIRTGLNQLRGALVLLPRRL